MVSDRREPPKLYPTGDDTNWRVHIDERMNTFEVKLDDNTKHTAITLELTQEIAAGLEDHKERTRPVIEAIEGMQSGVRAIGAFGNCVAWVAKTFWRLLRVTAPVAAALAAVWVAFHEHFDAIVQSLTWWKK